MARIERTVGRLLSLVVIALLAAFFRFVEPLEVATSPTMLLGLLLLAAFAAGKLARELHLPQITGYLTIGILFGPHLLGILSRQTVVDFHLIEGIALSVIALQAGGELHLERLRPRLGRIGVTIAILIVAGVVGVMAVVIGGQSLFPFLRDEPLRIVIATALIFGLVVVAMSPATTIAVITELRGQGPVTDTVLSITVLIDVVVLLLVALVLPSVTILVNPELAFDTTQLVEISSAIVISLALGGLIGWLIAIYLREVAYQPILFVLAVAFGVVELADVIGLQSESYILMSMAAGFVVQNFSAQGPPFLEALEINSLPLYALFFAVAGADLDLSAIPAVWAAGLLLIGARTALLFAGNYLGAWFTGDLPAVRRYAWMGFLAQAGVVLGLAIMVRERFGSWGPEVAAIIIAMVAFNQLVGPPLFRVALVRAGEGSEGPGGAV